MKIYMVIFSVLAQCSLVGCEWEAHFGTTYCLCLLDTTPHDVIIRKTITQLTSETRHTAMGVALLFPRVRLPCRCGDSDRIMPVCHGVSVEPAFWFQSERISVYQYVMDVSVELGADETAKCGLGLLSDTLLTLLLSVTSDMPRRILLNQLDALISQIYFWNKTLRVSDSSSVHHQEFFTVHTAMVYVIQVC